MSGWRSDIREIMGVAGPMTLAYLSVPLMGLVATAVMGRLDAAAHLGGMGLGVNFFAFFYFLFAFLRWSTTGLTANAAGAEQAGGDPAERMYVLLRSLGLAFAVGFLLVLLQAPLTLFALEFMGASGEVAASARDYCQARVLGAPALLGTYALTGYFIGSKRAGAVLAMTLGSNLVNIALLLALVYGAGLRADGAGWATSGAEFVGLAIGLVLALRGSNVAPSRLALRRVLDPQRLRALFGVNGDVFLKSLFTSAVFYGFLRASAGFETATLAANLVLMQMFYLASFLLEGFSNACEALAGRAHGAGDAGRARRLFMVCTLCAIAMGLLFTFAYAFAGHLFVYALTDLPQVVAAAEPLRLWLVLLPPLMGVAFVMEGLFVGTLRMRAMRNAAALACAAYFALWLLLAQRWGAHGLWLSLAAYFLLRPVFGFWLWRTERGPAAVRAA